MPRIPSDRRQAIIDYVRERLARECQVWGEASRIAHGTGFSSATITKIKDGERNPSDDFVDRIARYWGMEHSELEKVAVGKPDGATPAAAAPRTQGRAKETHPILAETLAWIRAQMYLYPGDFLSQYERQARLREDDRPREIILADLQVQYWDWRQARMGAAASGARSTSVADPAPAPEGAGAAKKTPRRVSGRTH